MRQRVLFATFEVLTTSRRSNAYYYLASLLMIRKQGRFLNAREDETSDLAILAESRMLLRCGDIIARLTDDFPRALYFRFSSRSTTTLEPVLASHIEGYVLGATDNALGHSLSTHRPSPWLPSIACS